MNQEQLRHMSVSAIYWYPRKRFFWVYPFVLLVLCYIIFDIMRQGWELSLSTFLISVVYFGIVILLMKSNRKMDRLISNMMYEDLNIQKYQDFLIYYQSRQKRPVPSQDINLGIVAFFKGDFETASLIFQGVTTRQSRVRLSKQVILQKDYFYVLSLIHSGAQLKEIDRAIYKMEETNYGKYGEVKERLKTNCEIVRNIITLKKPVDPFENSFGSSELLTTMYDFYLAENMNLIGDRNHSAAIWQKFSTKNPDLFYVQEAKRYVEELS